MVRVFADSPLRTHPPEYADAHGLVALRFAAKPCSLVGGHPEACVYLMKRERHRIKLEKPHLPPEGGSGSGSGGGKLRSVGPTGPPSLNTTVAAAKTSHGLGCAAGLSSSALDF